MISWASPNVICALRSRAFLSQSFSSSGWVNTGALQECGTVAPVEAEVPGLMDRASQANCRGGGLRSAIFRNFPQFRSFFAIGFDPPPDRNSPPPPWQLSPVGAISPQPLTCQICTSRRMPFGDDQPVVQNQNGHQMPMRNGQPPPIFVICNNSM